MSRTMLDRAGALISHAVSKALKSIALGSAIFVGVTPTYARSFRTVEVRGSEFIPEADIRMTCGAMANVDYLDIELQAIEDCLMSTGVFETVRLYPEDNALVIEVKEIDTRPGHIGGAISYVAQDGLVGELSFERYNLFPKTYGALHLAFNSEVRRIDANIYRADLFGENLDFGVDVIGKQDEYNDRNFSEQSLRIEPYLAWTPNEQVRVEAGLGMRDHKMYNVAAIASPLLQLEATPDSIRAPYARFGLGYSHTAPLGKEPGSWAVPGYSIKLEQYFWNLGTDDLLSDTRLEVLAQVPIASGLRLQTGLRLGTVTGLDGNDTRSIDRFFPGADTFRGFAPRGIGPRDGTDVLGGNRYFIGTLEVQRDFGNVMNLPLRGGIFFESGASWGLDNTLSGSIDDSWKSRSSIGISLTFEIEQTSLSLYLAKPVRKVYGDETQAFGLGFTSTF